MTLSSVALAFAQGAFNPSTAQQGQVNVTALYQLINAAQNIVTALVPFAIGLAVLAFFWFLITFIWKGDDPAHRKTALAGMGWSVVALFIMVSIWGIIGFLGSIVGVGQGGSIPTPTVPRP